ncbi:HD domain-containing protein [Candidatus Woesearchaeota archaeon]|jgi:putative hydrolase of HD superfamily|nr:HD domain-containing protein [Candidatus Woesearchaeota archaeon]MBT4150998.1 HD domain-containing protein [Candidatus Woesearchaeota archaeon]MBT4433788.1 HD domain-containing protein [Candidatus Woesearchaeota archaeon]MBT7332213.1 HD domain-containing protein [Candidatus Woesearchaeota archaeon]
MDTLNKLRKFYKLKHVERTAPVGNRKESTAEHTWSALILADHFLSIMEEKLDRLKVYELIMYHDVVEIEAGDIPVHHEKERENKKENEKAAAHILKEHMPNSLKNKFIKLFEEFEDEETREAKFAKAMDSLDALMHFLDYKEEWKGWDEKMVHKYHGEKMKDFPETKEAFEKLLIYCRDKGFFNQ